MEQIFALAYGDNDKNDIDDDDDEDEDENEDDVGEHDNSDKLDFVKLTYLKVICLPQLKTVWEGILICKSGLEPFKFDCVLNFVNPKYALRNCFMHLSFIQYYVGREFEGNVKKMWKFFSRQ